MKKYSLKIVFTLGGLIFGVLVAHPYIMLVYYFTSPDRGHVPGGGSVFTALAYAFSSSMLPMTLALSFFCGVIGFLSSLLVERNRKLARMQFAVQRQEAVMGSLQKLLSVLSHFILNSTMVIASSTRRLRSKVKGMNLPADFEKTLKGIEQQAKKNEAVLKLMQESDYLECVEGADRSMARIIELTRWLEDRISSHEAGGNARS